MIATVLIAGHLACPVSLQDAERLVLASPNIRAAVAQRGARPFFEYVEKLRKGWYFTVNSHAACSGRDACSALLGHYSVSRRTGEVIDQDAGEDGKPVTSPRLKAMQRNLIAARCR